MIPRIPEPEVMDTAEEAADYNGMDHSEVNRVFVDDLLAVLRNSAVNSPAELLDVGTGTALIPIEYCGRTAATGLLTAIDLSREMLKLAERNIAQAGLTKRIQTRFCDSKNLPFADGQFDVVMSNSIVHHIPEPLTCVAEMIRVLKPGGLLFVRDLLRPETSADVDRLVSLYAGNENENSRRLFRESLHAALTVAEVRELLHAAGVPGEWVRQTTDRHWTICGWLPVTD